jgi:hypothetical protein
VVLRGFVRRRGDHSGPAVVGVLHGIAAQTRVVHGAERLLHHEGAVVDRVQHGLREVALVGDERVAHPHVDRHAVRAGAELSAVVGLRGRVARLAGAVAVLHVVKRVVVVVEEVPAHDVVAEAVGVVVHAVREGDQHVLRVEHRAAVTDRAAPPRPGRRGARRGGGVGRD